MEKWHNFRIQQETETMAMHVLLVRDFSLEDTHPGFQLPQEINQKTQGVDVGDSGSGEDLALSLGANRNWVPQHGKVQPNDPGSSTRRIGVSTSSAACVSSIRVASHAGKPRAGGLVVGWLLVVSPCDAMLHDIGLFIHHSFQISSCNW